MDVQTRFQQLQAKLKASGHRATPQRVALLRIIAASTGHPSAMQIYAQLRRRFPTTTLATVYKTLALLKEMGEVLELEFSGTENRYDGNKPHPHLHLVCLKCQQIIDPEVTPLSHVSAQVAKTTGYQIVSQRFELYGICPRCQTVQETHLKSARRKQGGQSPRRNQQIQKGRSKSHE